MADKIEKMYWEELGLQYETSGKLIMQQQLLTHELIKRHSDAIDADKETTEIIRGLLLSYQDIAKELMGIVVKHGEFKGEGKERRIFFKRGEVKLGDDEEFTYLRLFAEYITVQEEITTLSTTGFIDIFTKLKLDDHMVEELKNTVNSGTEKINEEKTKLGALNG